MSTRREAALEPLGSLAPLPTVSILLLDTPRLTMYVFTASARAFDSAWFEPHLLFLIGSESV